MPAVIIICITIFVIIGIFLWTVLHGSISGRDSKTKEKLDDEQEKALAEIKNKK